MLSAPVDLGPVRAQTRNEPGQLPTSSKIVNSVVVDFNPFSTELSVTANVNPADTFMNQDDLPALQDQVLSGPVYGVLFLFYVQTKPFHG